MDAEHSHTVKCKFTFILYNSISKFPLASIFCNNFQRVILYLLFFSVRFQGRYIKTADQGHKALYGKYQKQCPEFTVFLLKSICSQKIMSVRMQI